MSFKCKAERRVELGEPGEQAATEGGYCSDCAKGAPMAYCDSCPTAPSGSVCCYLKAEAGRSPCCA